MSEVLIGIPLLLAGGGTEIHVLGLVRALVTGGHGATICCYYEFDEPVVELFEQAGARVIRLGLTRSREHFGPAAMVLLLRRIVKVIREVQPDIVHVQYLAPGLLAILGARIAGVRKIFATSHIAGSYAYGLRAKALLRIAARVCTAFFCVSQGVEKFWFGDSRVFDPTTATPGRRHYTVYNAVDVERIRRSALSSSESQSVRTSGSRKIIGIVGRLAEQKGHAVLLEAMKEVVRKVHDAVLLVIGDGPERNSLEQTAESSGLKERVKWLGVKPQEEVFRLYGSMDVFAMPSLYEGFGLTAAEAMAAELPVVGTAIEGLSEVVEDGVTGYLVPLGDSKAIAQKLIALLNDAGLRRRMGQAGYERVKERFGMERFRESMLAAYQYYAKRL